ncbi:cysteine dioxygenase [Raphidocelis subcapitata]|uniref:Cysteine dioxygenase n=1 Tax=Raphidocelis subcapitata TaxID=307507 RepID=A0A2V0PBE8_9CHLO|nr:cysteine dioxygenase [Raphidocelis subcapitata]|eukprot:GBF96262.1 cysteine dioxygenase [Raphidocelis subcapitata]
MGEDTIARFRAWIRRAFAGTASSQDGSPKAGRTASRIGSATRSGPLMQLYEDLCKAFAHEKALGYAINNAQDPESFARLDAAVSALVRAYIEAGHTDYRRYANFNPHHYVRNLIEENEDFELMILCWQKGQGSRVHNHADSHGWLTPLYGEMVEHQYEVTDAGSGEAPADVPPLPGVLAATSPCPTLRHLRTTRVGAGVVTYINDRLALHSVRCPDDCPTEPGGITLHIYSPPIRRVKLYEPESDRIVLRKPGFFTVRGRKLREKH